MATRVYRINASTLMRRMKAARDSGVWPITFKVGPYSFTEWSVQGRAAIYVAYHQPESECYLGRIQRGKLFPQRTFRLRRDLRAIRAFVENPLQAAAAAASAAERPVCACCSRPLGTRDVKNGIGEKCFTRWGWDTLGTKRRSGRKGRATQGSNLLMRGNNS